jgi:hypothetical protein
MSNTSSQMNQRQTTDDPHAGEYSGLRLSLIKFALFLVWVSYCLLLLLLSSTFGLLVMLTVAVPTILVAEWLSARVLANKYGWSTLPSGFSIKRIVFNVLLILGLGAGTYLVLRLLS